jgi:membrane fusion protein, copper/silver efflux system
MKNYRKAFFTAVAVNALLAVAAILFWRRSAVTRRVKPSVAASMPSQTAPEGAPARSPASEPQAPLAPVQLSPQRLQAIGVQTGTVERKPVSKEIRTVGNVEVDERRLSDVALRFPGWIQKVFVDATYQRVRQGQPLLTIYSPDLVTTENEYLLARKNADLLAGSSVPGVASGSASLAEASRARLEQWQVPKREIERLERTGEPRDNLEIDSPVSGWVLERNALPNMYVQPATRLYRVADLTTVWVYGQVFQNDIAAVHGGDRAELSVDTYPGKTFMGRVDFVYPEVDMATRTARVRFVFPNPGLKLLPGMFVNVTLRPSMGARLVVPAGAVFHTGTRNLVFVDHGQGYLEPREVEIGARAGDEFVVLAGLKEGERVVTSANFLIDSESQLQASMGAFAPPPPGAGQAASMNAPAEPARMEFETEPSPPRKGDNVFRIHLTSSDGKPIDGAQVQVTFFMAAMPSMGMAAMRTASTLRGRGNGLYEGKGKLESGGTWQVTVIAEKDGKPIASKQLTVNATGGM